MSIDQPGSSPGSVPLSTAASPGPEHPGAPSTSRKGLRHRLRVLRHAPDRWLHPLRRRAALSRLAGRAPEAVLFVCHGNIYRSPFAAYAFAQSVASARVESAGFVGPDRPSPDDAVARAARAGVDLTPHRSRLLTDESVRGADLIVVVNVAQRREVCARWGVDRSKVLVLGDLDPEPIVTREIEDPWRGEPEVLDRSYARVERCVRELARELGGSRDAPAGAGVA